MFGISACIQSCISFKPHAYPPQTKLQLDFSRETTGVIDTEIEVSLFSLSQKRRLIMIYYYGENTQKWLAEKKQTNVRRSIFLVQDWLIKMSNFLPPLEQEESWMHPSVSTRLRLCSNYIPTVQAEHLTFWI